jgi:hypothetical protein
VCSRLTKIPSTIQATILLLNAEHSAGAVPGICEPHNENRAGGLSNRDVRSKSQTMVIFVTAIA